MCDYVGIDAALPGWGCCRCHIYNGLHRLRCKSCTAEHHPFEIPPDILQCVSCGFGFRESERSALERRQGSPTCPICDVELPAPIKETVH